MKEDHISPKTKIQLFIKKYCNCYTYGRNLSNNRFESLKHRKTSVKKDRIHKKLE